MVALCSRFTRRKCFSTEIWKMRRYSDHLTVGPILFLNVMFYNFSKVSVALRKLPEGGISTFQDGWKHGYSALNSEKTIFTKRKDHDFIIHRLFVDDMMHI